MKKIVFLLLVAFAFTLSAKAQHFDQYFEDKTVRINYLHIGNAHSESIRIDQYKVGDGWFGTRAFLKDPYNYGDITVEVYDSTSNKLIYSRSYSTLFCEYRTTERGETEVAEMEECVNIPMPKQTVRLIFVAYDRSRVATKLLDIFMNPTTTAMAPMTKDYPVMNLHKGGSPKKAIDILLIPDGYAKSDAKLLKHDMRRFASYIMNCSPYKEMAKKVNIRAIKGFSEQSGITQPQNNFYVKTLLNCTYNALDLDRYLMCLNVWNMYDVADDAPFDAIIIICNSEKYGGGGIYNFYCTVYNHGEYPDYVVVHEMGHLIGGLADEYYTSEVSVQDFYPAGTEPTEPNVTTLVDFDSKWKDLVKEGTPIPTPTSTKNSPDYDRVGAYEGGGYVSKGVYRPTQHCTMNTIVYDDFCPVCLRTLKSMIDYYSLEKSE
ncbi:MAG: IgA Peptidase M64 [Bacteroidales bacterium]|nr:IgA Peptidase M64 [Bacteroidales bacterium]